MMHHEEMVWGVTIDFQARFRKPVPLDAELRVRSRITKNDGRMFEGSGEVLLPNGDVAVEGKGRYMKMPLSKIADFDEFTEEWIVVPHENDPVEFELPDLP
jgi:hypothetical protein